MNPKEKAKELIEKYCQVLFGDEQFVSLTNPVQCSLIAVDEILEATPLSPHSGDYYETTSDRIDEVREYWVKVKEEITNL